MVSGTEGQYLSTAEAISSPLFIRSGINARRGHADYTPPLVYTAEEKEEEDCATPGASLLHYYATCVRAGIAHVGR